MKDTISYWWFVIFLCFLLLCLILNTEAEIIILVCTALLATIFLAQMEKIDLLPLKIKKDIHKLKRIFQRWFSKNQKL